MRLILRIVYEYYSRKNSFVYENSEIGKNTNIPLLLEPVSDKLFYPLFPIPHNKSFIISKFEDLLLWTECMSPTFTSICWNSNSQCDGIWKWGLGKIIRFRWGHEDGAVMMELVPLSGETPEHTLSLSFIPAPLPYEDRGRRQLSISHKGSSHKKPNLAGHWSCRLPNCEKMYFCCLSHPVYSILSW